MIVIPTWTVAWSLTVQLGFITRSVELGMEFGDVRGTDVVRLGFIVDLSGRARALGSDCSALHGLHGAAVDTDISAGDEGGHGDCSIAVLRRCPPR
jgi:hypothetical protein